MNWVRGDKWYIASDCGRYTVTGDTRSDGRVRYGAWRRVRKASVGHPFNPPICLGLQFETSDAAKQACIDDAAQKVAA